MFWHRPTGKCEGCCTAPWAWNTKSLIKVYDHDFLADVKILDNIWSVNYRSAKFKYAQIARSWKCLETSIHSIFTILSIHLWNLTLKILIDIYNIGYFTDKFVKWRSVKYRPACEMRTRSRDVIKFSGRYSVTHIQTLTKMIFWWVELNGLKTTL